MTDDSAKCIGGRIKDTDDGDKCKLDYKTVCK